MQAKVKNNTLIIYVNGDLDHHNAEKIKDLADMKIMENRIKNVIFDFENSNFMDSSGIGVIMGRYKLVENIGGIICAVNMNQAVKRIFSISGLFKIIRQYDTVQDAMSVIGEEK